MAGILRLDWTEVEHVGGYIEFTARKSNSFQHKLIKIIAIPYLGSSTVCLEAVVVQCREVGGIGVIGGAGCQDSVSAKAGVGGAAAGGNRRNSETGGRIKNGLCFSRLAPRQGGSEQLARLVGRCSFDFFGQGGGGFDKRVHLLRGRAHEALGVSENRPQGLLGQPKPGVGGEQAH
jgi:hypothetical protein